jgi:hypothetical protein
MKKINKMGKKFIVFWVLISLVLLFVTCEDNTDKLPEDEQSTDGIPNNSYIVIYNKNAADATGTMENSIFTVGVYGNLSISSFERDNYCFLGWAKTAASTTEEYADGQWLTENLTTAKKTITLYAVWHEAYTVNVTQGSTLEQKLTWITNNAESYTTYIIEINSSQSLNQSLSYGAKKHITIHLKGNGSISKPSNNNNPLFIIRNSVTLILDGNLTLSGSSNFRTNLELIRVTGKLILNGGKIFGNNASMGVGGVYVMGGTFIMNGGEISGNTADYDGGGVYVSSGTFTMNNGEISRNTSRRGGGGVYVIGGTFDKTGGTITGSNSANGNVLRDSSGNIINNRGRAVYVPGGTSFEKRKETTAGPGDNLSFKYNDDGNPTWSGAWDY